MTAGLLSFLAPRQHLQPLDLSAPEQQALKTHAALVERWGWRVTSAGPALGETADAPVSTRASPAAVLSCVPLLAGVALGGLDLKLYLHQLAECGGDAGGAGPPGVLRVLRSKACRGAVMFNDALSPQRCAELVDRLSTTQLPFCCAVRLAGG
ncbi:hypothetical protein MNEG_0240 [Monoraphidium neglectum]|uniref:Uncharacterized protein n=1 Tax=Monoraphidium neglectum TaxID=145388 RepID=A0A0D2KCC5_9CHLO|nr:hypothetical protein MNEG_0240 [Monoraphidium neglectum]KIZ07708.1 hypothetical protein MNEG_0240 [Monoraphidium neglectum]|eukprot:XP_013906727.1 hypothetical protein MNEG_0240 [Monoraphidium neglectum]